MALQREKDYPEERLFSFQPTPLKTTPFTSYSYPGERLTEAFANWADKPQTLLFPNGQTINIEPDISGMESRYDALALALQNEPPEGRVHGVYGELLGGVLLHMLVQQATQGEYAVVPALPQLDVTGRRSIRVLPEAPLEKTGDVMFGRVIEESGKQVILPLMLFDIKSSAHTHRRAKHVESGVNIGLMPLPVGVIYLGELTFEDKSGKIHSTASYIDNVVYPAALNNMLPWSTLWPSSAQNNPQRDLFKALCEEVFQACSCTRERIVGYRWPNATRQSLLQRLEQTEQTFQNIEQTIHEATSAV